MTKLSNPNQSINSQRLAPSIASTVNPDSKPSYNEWQEGIKAELHTTAPAHRKPLMWNQNTFKK